MTLNYRKANERNNNAIDIRDVNGDQMADIMCPIRSRQEVKKHVVSMSMTRNIYVQLCYSIN